MIENFASWFSHVFLLWVISVSLLGSRFLKISPIWFQFFRSFYFFLISFFDTRLLGFEFHDFLCFSFYGVTSISCPELQVSRVNSGRLKFFFLIYFCFSFSFHHLVFFKVDINFLIQLFLYKIISVLWSGCDFGMLIWTDFFYSFLKLIFFLVCPSMFDLLVVELKIIFIFIFMRLSCSYSIFILLPNNIIETF